MSKPLVSIIMPVYNCEITIKQAILSILNQSYKNIELIICDDGSVDKTIEKINEINDERIKFYKNECNIGNLLTTNKLLSICKGDFIAIQDADDYSKVDRIETQLEYILKFNVDLVGTTVGILKNEKVIDIIENPKRHEDIIKGIVNEKKLSVVWGSVLFKKEIYNDIGGFNTVFNRKGAADIEWMGRAIKKYKFCNINRLLYIYRQHSQSFTKAIDLDNENIISRLFSEEIALDMYDRNDNENIEDFFYKRLNYYRKHFIDDKSKLINIYFSKLIFGEIGYFIFFIKLLTVKSNFKNKIKFFGMAIIFILGGNSFLYWVKSKLR